MFDVQKRGSDVAPKWIAPEDEQEPNESRRLWRDLTQAILAKDMDAATEAKTAVENAQRELRATGVKHTTRFFELRDDHSWAPRIRCVFSPHRWEPLLCLLCSIADPTNTGRTFLGSPKTHKKPLLQYKRGYGLGRPMAAQRQQTPLSTPTVIRLFGCWLPSVPTSF